MITLKNFLIFNFVKTIVLIQTNRAKINNLKVF